MNFLNRKNVTAIRVSLKGALCLVPLALTGCGTLFETNLTETFAMGAGYVGEKVAAGWNAAKGLENASVGALREMHFGGEKDAEKAQVSLRAKSINLRTNADGEGFSRETLEAANAFLTSQGPLSRQVLTVVPITKRGRAVAERLARALESAGAREIHLGRYAVQRAGKTEFPDRASLWDVELISESYVVTVPDCRAQDAGRWTIAPFEALGALGCANRANLARMTSDPRDLVRPRALDDADGALSELSVRKYQKGDTEEFPDIDFSQDE